jgi:hypothetical protein
MHIHTFTTPSFDPLLCGWQHQCWFLATGFLTTIIDQRRAQTN